MKFQNKVLKRVIVIIFIIRTLNGFTEICQNQDQARSVLTKTIIRLDKI